MDELKPRTYASCLPKIPHFLRSLVVWTIQPRVSFCLVQTTDITQQNIHTDIADKWLCDRFVRAELQRPSPRKATPHATIYHERDFDLPDRLGVPVLGNFEKAVRGDLGRNHDAQSDEYWALEVILRAKWSYSVDIWNVGVLVRLPADSS